MTGRTGTLPARQLGYDPAKHEFAPSGAPDIPTQVAGVAATSIGEHVWRYFDRWIAQTEYWNSWGRNWIPLVERGLVDYYLVSAHKSAVALTAR